jgi:Ni,Fe-hydrogenase I large subunit
MHEIVLDGDRIADYLIVAPTEWNFHPQGALVDRLVGQGTADRDALRQHVAHIVAALDPCVPWELEWA